MPVSRFYFVLVGILGVALAGVPSGTCAQVPPPPPQPPGDIPPPPPMPEQVPPPPGPGQVAVPGQEPGIEVLTRGQVHEAFAATAEMPIAGPVIPKVPPQPIEEMPPDQRPAGQNVQWLPGYWHFDEERNDYIWISGFWRVAPPGKVWVPGNWHEVQGGVQWAAGFWQSPPQSQQQVSLQYLPPPPPHPEVVVPPQPTATSVYIPGTWVWRGRYVWQPGFWNEFRPGWMWVPSHYRWTPVGYIFVDGYWDHPLDGRGMMYAPVAFAPGVYARPGFVYTPVYAVSPSCMYGAMFVRSGHGAYYFGDYFGPRYATVGYSAWCGSASGTTFTVAVGVGRGVPYDPMWGYYRVAYRSDPAWMASVNTVYVGRYRGDIPPPPRTIVQQTTIINNININVGVVNVNVVNSVMVAPVRTIQRTNVTLVMAPVHREEIVREVAHARELRAVAVQRQRVEVGLVGRPIGATPHVVALEVPHTVVARAVVVSPGARVVEHGPLHPEVGRPGVMVPGHGPIPPKVLEKKIEKKIEHKE
ncbi:hypothetical protein [Fimbriiglobus ruber]|uniref:Lipoprotein n=1 Tax=Fimbriiglobus ruber TaxID=1908690 RepID=A0A225DK90_9BACT|nr:hypothetical protein [Fimbriiglobus ruber]OWK41890.1 hypothetical protein FRUB_03968 [Fimbriiglobus ruber]